MLSVADVEEILAIPLLGVIPESKSVLAASNSGEPVILDDAATRARPTMTPLPGFWARTCPTVSSLRPRKGFFARIFGG
jgi:septum site-determining protein MinD